MENTQAQQPSPELTLVDLQNLRAIVDLASRRGAFGAGELSAVGATFDKLNTFLQSVLPAQTEDQPAQTQGE